MTDLGTVRLPITADGGRCPHIVVDKLGSDSYFSIVTRAVAGGDSAVRSYVGQRLWEKLEVGDEVFLSLTPKVELD